LPRKEADVLFVTFKLKCGYCRRLIPDPSGAKHWRYGNQGIPDDVNCPHCGNDQQTAESFFY
jgi:hypothetical protein